MSVIISNREIWLANKWITFKLFEDFLHLTKKESNVSNKIQYLLDVKIDTLDISGFNEGERDVFVATVTEIIKYNAELQGSDMSRLDYFGIYYFKLLELDRLLGSGSLSQEETIERELQGLVFLIKENLSPKNLTRIEQFLAQYKLKSTLEVICESIFDDEIILHNNYSKRINELCEELKLDEGYWMDMD